MSITIENKHKVERVIGTVGVKGYAYKKMYYVRVQGILHVDYGYESKKIEFNYKDEHAGYGDLTELVKNEIEYLLKVIPTKKHQVLEVFEKEYRINIYE